MEYEKLVKEQDQIIWLTFKVDLQPDRESSFYLVFTQSNKHTRHEIDWPQKFLR